MRDVAYYHAQIEGVVKRLKKSEMADHFARQLARLDAEREELRVRVKELERDANEGEPTEIPSCDATRVAGVLLGENYYVSAPLMFTIEASYDALVRLLGEPNVDDTDDYRITTVWAFVFQGENYVLRDFDQTKKSCDGAPFADAEELREANVVEWQVIGAWRLRGGANTVGPAVALQAAIKTALANYDGEPLPPTRVERACAAVLTMARSDVMREALGIVLDAAREVAERSTARVEKLEEKVTEIEEERNEYQKQVEEESKSRDDASNALVRIREDRNALLARLGLTDREWSAMGGACEADFEV